MDPGRRGEYGGVSEVFSTLGGRWAPALYTFLAMSWHPAGLPGAGWLVIAGIAIVAVVGHAPRGPPGRAVPASVRASSVRGEPPADDTETAVVPSLS